MSCFAKFHFCMKSFVSLAFSTLILSSFAEDLTVASGQTFTLESSANYGTVNVSGTVNIPSGMTLEATTLNLGPNSGDTAVINVLGTTVNSLKAGQVNIGGANGGCGKIVSMESAPKDNRLVLNIPNVTIHSNATSSANGTIDFLELGSQCVRKIGSWKNNSKTKARIRVNGGQLGYEQNFSGTYFTGPFLIEGYDENSNITIANSWTGNWALNNGDIEISTLGAVTIDYSSSQPSYNLSINKAFTWNGISELILKSKVNLLPHGIDLLPYGKNVGPIRIESTSVGIDLQFYQTHINGLIAKKRAVGASPAVKGTKLAKLIFGADDVDGVFSGDVARDVTIQKIGTGTLHVNDQASCGSLTVKDGTLKVSSSLDIETLVVEEGATLIVDGVNLEPSKAICIQGELVLVNGGTYKEETVVSSDDISRIEGLSSTGRLVKDGTGTCLLAGSQSVAEEIHVKNGTLDFCAGGYQAKLFKFNFTNWKNVGWTEHWREGQFLLDEIALIDASSQRIGFGTLAAEVGTNPADLQPGYAAFAEGVTVTNNFNVDRLFDSLDVPRVHVTSPLTTDPGGVTIYWRLKDDDPAPVAWNFAAGFGGIPSDWTVSASFDNGSTWEVLNSESNFTASDSYSMRWFEGFDIKVSGNNVPPRFPLYSTSSSFVANGAPNMPSAVNLRVDNGATIDFSNVIGSQQNVNVLTIDVSGGNGGTIKNAVFEEEGIINLVSDTGVYSTTDIAFNFVNCSGMNNFNNWRVKCDGLDVSDNVATYNEETSTFHCTFSSITISENGEGNLLSEIDGLLVLYIDSDVSYTNTTALSGSGTIKKTGAGSLVLSESANSFTGDIVVMSGKVIAPGNDSLGTGTLYVKGSTSQECQIVLGSETQAVTYNNNFVFLESSSSKYPAIFFVTKNLKSTTINGKITAYGTVEMRDSAGGGNPQYVNLVTFNGDVEAEGQVISYPTDNATVWNGRITAQSLRANAGWPRAGFHSLFCPSNQLGKIEVGYNNFTLYTNSLNGAAVCLVGNNTEVGRGFLEIKGDQTVAWIDQEYFIAPTVDRPEGSKKRYYADTASTLTLTGGTQYAKCQLYLLDCNILNEKTSFVLDSQNDDFVQVFTNSAWTASGDFIIRNGTLCFAGESSAQNISKIEIEGGSFELNSTLENAMANVTNVVMGANTRLRIASNNAFAENVEFTIGDGAILELPEGIELEINRATYDGSVLSSGVFTGKDGVGATRKSWIVGAGILRVKKGNGFCIIVR